MNALILLTIGLAAPPTDGPKGTLVAVGGGTMPEALTKQVLQLAGGPEAPILVIPQASELADTGQRSADMWRKAGAKVVSELQINDRALLAIHEARLIWMPGGDQSRLMKALPAETIEAIRVRYRVGAVVGGTSAGAAVLSSVMLTGEGDKDVIRAGSTKTIAGMNLWPNVIVDQHFIARQRFNRLFSAVLDRPELLGVGVDESTAAILRGNTVEVAGDRQVMIIDARTAEKSPANAPRSARDVKIHLLTAGMKFELK
ncbi:MAG: cyanophycinase [Gemmataceae bacterium]